MPVEEVKITKEVKQQRHQPLEHLEGKFSKAQGNWTTFEKEAFAIVNIFGK